MYERLRLVLRIERVSCEGGAGAFWSSIPEFVKLEVGSMRRKVKAYMSGATDVLMVREIPAVGTAR